MVEDSIRMALHNQQQQGQMEIEDEIIDPHVLNLDEHVAFNAKDIYEGLTPNEVDTIKALMGYMIIDNSTRAMKEVFNIIDSIVNYPNHR